MLQACSPEPVYRLKAEADEKQTSYYQGVEYIHMQKDSVFVTVSYYKHTANMFALEVEVDNQSNRIVRVAPDSLGYKSFSGHSPKHRGQILTFEQAKSPEQKILELDLALSQQKANQQTNELLYFTLQGVTLASGIAAETEEQREEAGEDLAQNAVHQQVDRAEYRYDRSSLRSTREYWEAKTLRITDLWPGESVRGLVYFRTDTDARLYQILMHLDELNFDTWFRQKKYDPGSKHYE
jgi:hypothetical protein